MSKHDDEFENEFENEFDDDKSDGIDGDDDIDIDDEITEEILIVEDSDDLFMTIEISEEVDEVIADDIILSKHKVEGKHSLKYDSIFKGKKEDKQDIDDPNFMYYDDNFEVDRSSTFYTESYDNEYYFRSKVLKERVYDVLVSHTQLNFMNNRRKPSKTDFNHYFNLLKIHLEGESFTNTELFNELSVYFSDNLFNMFKLLDNKWRNLIIKELQEHIGKTSSSKEVTNRNIYVGTEIEFKHYDDDYIERTYSGVVVETYYQDSMFKVDSFENIYMVSINDIVCILNNNKFKYNLNKLNNIDFL